MLSQLVSPEPTSPLYLLQKQPHTECVHHVEFSRHRPPKNTNSRPEGRLPIILVLLKSPCAQPFRDFLRNRSKPAPTRPRPIMPSVAGSGTPELITTLRITMLSVASCGVSDVSSKNLNVLSNDLGCTKPPVAKVL